MYSRYVILVECKPDELLIRELGYRHVLHGSNKTEILKHIARESTRSSRRIIAVVDEDPGSPYPKSFRLSSFSVVIDDVDLGIRVLKHRSADKYVVFLRSYLEDWIIKACRESRINLREYDLPDDPIGLHRIINVNLAKFKSILRELLKHGNRRVLRLKKIIGNITGERSNKKGSPGP